MVGLHVGAYCSYDTFFFIESERGKKVAVMQIYAYPSGLSRSEHLYNVIAAES